MIKNSDGCSSWEKNMEVLGHVEMMMGLAEQIKKNANHFEGNLW